MELLGFRIFILLSFILAAWRWGDWRNWQRYYPTMLFVMLVNMSASYLSYHHGLWNYTDDFLVTTETTVELLNTFVNLPATVMIYLSQFPDWGKLRKIIYIAAWAILYSILEFLDHFVFGGIYYAYGWSWRFSVIFDIAMFSIIRIHFINPWKGWLITGVLAMIVIIHFGFITAEMK